MAYYLRMRNSLEKAADLSAYFSTTAETSAPQFWIARAWMAAIYPAPAITNLSVVSLHLFHTIPTRATLSSGIFGYPVLMLSLT